MSEYVSGSEFTTGSPSSVSTSTTSTTSVVPRGTALRLKIDVATPLLRVAMSTYWRSGDPGTRYIEYLQTMHMVIRASVPLMDLAVSRCAELAPYEPAAVTLRSYLIRHIAEERHHDDWIVDDLRATGFDPTALLAEQPAPVIAALVGSQYYWVNHYHPVCLLGYIAVLEGHAPSSQLSERLRAATGFPAEAFRALDHHADVDDRHAAQLYQLLDGLPLTASQDAAVGVSALHTAASLTELFNNGAHRAHAPHGPNPPVSPVPQGARP